MAPDQLLRIQAASDSATQAAAVAVELKPGTYEAVGALALISIAHNLAVSLGIVDR
ncbi:MAG: hypothetical protein WCF36_06695 [Candidatus Nanopelagicales bacterium]